MQLNDSLRIFSGIYCRGTKSVKYSRNVLECCDVSSKLSIMCRYILRLILSYNVFA